MSTVDIPVGGWQVADAIGWIALSIVFWLSRRTVERLDTLKETAVTRDELERYMNDNRSERREMHTENISALEDIKADLKAIEPGVLRTRLDQIALEVDRLRMWRHRVDPDDDRRDPANRAR